MRLTHIVPIPKSAISHVFCCISTFSTCYVILTWPELYDCHSKEIAGVCFQVKMAIASAEQTWLYNTNTDSLYRFWRLTKLFGRENCTELWAHNFWRRFQREIMSAALFHTIDTCQILAYAIDGPHQALRRSCHFSKAMVLRPLIRQPLNTIVVPRQQAMACF